MSSPNGIRVKEPLAKPKPDHPLSLVSKNRPSSLEVEPSGTVRSCDRAEKSYGSSEMRYQKERFVIEIRDP